MHTKRRPVCTGHGIQYVVCACDEPHSQEDHRRGALLPRRKRWQRHLIVERSVVHELYCVKTYDPDTHHAPHSAMVADIKLWHQRMAHVHVDGIRDMIRHGVVKAVKLDNKQNVSR